MGSGEFPAMVRSFDHLTIVVRDPAPARAFFAVLGFREAVSCVIKGEDPPATWAFRVSRRST